MDSAHGGNDIKDRTKLAIWSEDSFGAGTVTCPCEQWRLFRALVNIGKNLRDEATTDADSVKKSRSKRHASRRYYEGKHTLAIDTTLKPFGNFLEAGQVLPHKCATAARGSLGINHMLVTRLRSG